MFQKLMLAVTMTFALNLLLGTRLPVNTQTGFSAKVDGVQILKDRSTALASVSTFER